MNRHAVALAADSATTVTQWVNGKQEERYFKGANKIFQLSNYQPVGLMIYDAASLHKAPWEIIIKAFRTHLKKQSHPTLKGYCDDLFNFIKNHPHIFTPAYQESVFFELAGRAALRYAVNADDEDTVKNAPDGVSKRAAHDKLFAAREAEVAGLPVPAFCTQADIDAAIAAHAATVEAQITALLTAWKLDSMFDLPALARLGINTLFKQYSKCMDATGMVIAGYGEEEYLPSFREYQFYGLLLGHLIVDETGTEQVTYDNQAMIKPFATTSMVETFSMGFSEDVFGMIRRELVKELFDFSSKITAAMGQPNASVPGLGQIVRDSMKAYIGRWTSEAMENHAVPLRRVIGSLPVDEMADLAETLINLQSLKEKVTQPTESVSGPVDVAVITKSDGFIWIKRKHYFDPALNPRFFVRQRELG